MRSSGAWLWPLNDCKGEVGVEGEVIHRDVHIYEMPDRFELVLFILSNLGAKPTTTIQKSCERDNGEG